MKDREREARGEMATRRREVGNGFFPRWHYRDSNKRTLLGGHCFRIRLLHLMAVKDLIYAE